jgi:hypothetical protein
MGGAYPYMDLNAKYGKIFFYFNIWLITMAGNCGHFEKFMT